MNHFFAAVYPDQQEGLPNYLKGELNTTIYLSPFRNSIIQTIKNSYRSILNPRMEMHPFFHFYLLKVNVLLPLFNIWPAAVRAATSSLPEYWDNRLSIWTAVVEGFNMDTCKYYRMRSYEISQPQN